MSHDEHKPRVDIPERLELERARSDQRKEGGDEPLKNGCCRGCMKAFSETKKVC